MLVARVSQNSFVLVLFLNGASHNLLRDTLQNAVPHSCACVKLSAKGVGIAPFWGRANLPEKVSRDMGYRSDIIATSRNMRPLSLVEQRREKRTRPPPKQSPLGNLSGLKEKLSKSVWIQKTPPKSFLRGPHFFRQRKVLYWSRAVYAFFCPVVRIEFAGRTPKGS